MLKRVSASNKWADQEELDGWMDSLVKAGWPGEKMNRKAPGRIGEQEKQENI